MDLSRNYLAIDDWTQQELSQKVILIAGCGMGSRLAEDLVRIGFKNLIIADGDSVEPSNLNRQNFVHDDIGKNKALVVKKRLLQINPTLNVTAIEHFLEAMDLEQLMPNCDYFINTIDFDHEAAYYAQSIARKNGVYEIFTINVLFGSALYFFKPCDGVFSEEFGLENVQHKIMRNIVQHCRIPKGYLKKFLQYKQEKRAFEPQNTVATAFSSALTVSTIVSHIAGVEISSGFRPRLDALEVAPASTAEDLLLKWMVKLRIF